MNNKRLEADRIEYGNVRTKMKRHISKKRKKERLLTTKRSEVSADR